MDGYNENERIKNSMRAFTPCILEKLSMLEEWSSLNDKERFLSKIIIHDRRRENVTLNVFYNFSFCDIFTNRTKK